MINGGRQLSRDGTSRMNREVHVRFCEGLGVKFPGPTRQTRTIVLIAAAAASAPKADLQFDYSNPAPA
jgi:hypothetical protein